MIRASNRREWQLSFEQVTWASVLVSSSKTLKVLKALMNPVACSTSEPDIRFVNGESIRVDGGIRMSKL